LEAPVAQILVVDDSPAIRLLISRVLTHAKHQVILASSGGEALRIAEEQTIDAAIIDYHIPPPNGLEVLARLRKRWPDSVRILISGSLDMAVTLDAVNRGEASRVLAKPFDLGTLVSAVEDGLRARRKAGERYVTAVAAEADCTREALADCMSGGTLQLAVQPIVDAATGEPFAFEALLRSSHPTLNGPLPVLRAAEQHGMLPTLGALVAQRAAGWIERLPPDVKLFVNLHPEELADPARLVRGLEPLVPHARRVVLEITERCRAMDVRGWQTSVEQLMERGFELAVDDLGSGYSSLSVLAALRPRFIKIDMSLIRDIDTDLHKQRLFSLVCRFAEATDARVVGEGVETEAEAAACRLCGASLLQGYYFGRPHLKLQELKVLVGAS
jgi:EAL domain-containing protein (putative c-di-GMP-specific phosphodiesterase class I)